MNLISSLLQLLDAFNRGHFNHFTGLGLSASTEHSSDGVGCTGQLTLCNFKAFHQAQHAFSLGSTGLVGSLRLNIEVSNVAIIYIVNDFEALGSEQLSQSSQGGFTLAGTSVGADVELGAVVLGQRQSILVVLHQHGSLQVQSVSLLMSGFNVGGTHFVSLLVIQVRILEAALLEQSGSTVHICAIQVSLVQDAQFYSRDDVLRSQFSTDGVSACTNQQSKALNAGHVFHAIGLRGGDARVRVHEASEAHDVTQQGGDDFRVVSGAKACHVHFMSTIGLGHRTAILGVTRVAGHDGANTGIDSGLEANQLILLQRALGGIQTILTLRGVRLEAVLGSTVAGEVLSRQHNGVLVHAIGAILVAIHQSGDDASGHVRTLAVGAGVPGPTGVGYQVDLGTIHEDDALCAPHFTINLCICLDGIIVAVAQHCSSHTQRVGEAGRDGVGNQGYRDCRSASLSRIPFCISGGHVVEQSNNRSIVIQAAAIHASTNLTDGQHLIIQASKGGSVLLESIQVRGALAFRNNGHDLHRIDGAILVLHFGKRLGNRHCIQSIQHKASLLGEGHLGDHVLGTLFSVHTPVFENVQLVVVIKILEVLAVHLQHAHGGHTNGGFTFAVFVVNRLQIGVSRINLCHIVGCSNVLGLAFCQGSRHNAQQHHASHDRAQNSLHDSNSFSLVSLSSNKLPRASNLSFV